jgi:hypothetical protein
MPGDVSSWSLVNFSKSHCGVSGVLTLPLLAVKLKASPGLFFIGPKVF